MHHNNDRQRRLDGARGRLGRTTLALGAAAALALSGTAGASAWMAGGSNPGMQPNGMHSHHGHNSGKPIRAVVLTPSAGDRTSSGFNIDVSLQAKNARGNNLLSGYSTLFNDPTGPDGKPNPAFHPGSSAAAPGLVVTLSTTPNRGPGTPLQGPATNLAGVFQINSVTKSHGLRQTWNDWQVTSPGFFGQNTPATLTVYAVRGKAPDVIPAGGLTPISNVVHETFNVGS
jgi:hypothetical protein